MALFTQMALFIIIAAFLALVTVLLYTSLLETIIIRNIFLFILVFLIH